MPQRWSKKGYEKAKPGLFRIPSFQRWTVLPTSVELIDDIRKAPDNVLGTRELFRESFQLDYTLDFFEKEDAYETRVVRSRLTRNIAATFDQIQDELDVALREYIPVSNEEWVKVSILPAMQRIICRASSRVFVGVPLCRNRDYQTLIMDFKLDFMKLASTLALFPKPLKPFVVRMTTNLPSKIRQMAKFIRPLVEERLTKLEELGETWDDAPNDMLMWLMSEAKGVERSPEGLARRLLLVNFAAINATSLMVSQVLCRLISNPEYIEPLRQEVEAAVADEGWTKVGMDKMRKIDSFLRETQRVDVESIVMPICLTLRPFTFSSGVTVPADTVIALPVHAIHSDEEIYPNAEKFDGSRFTKLRDEEGDVMWSRHQAITASAKLLAFGIGRHARPGRFFAVNEMKALIAHIIVTYDFKFEEGKVVPDGHQIGMFRDPGNIDMMFRKRRNRC